jgi:hypothetical protein
MSSIDPRRETEPAGPDESDRPSTAVASDVRRTDPADDDVEHGRHVAEPDGAIQDSERRDTGTATGSTRVLPATDRTTEHDRLTSDTGDGERAGHEAPTAVVPPVPPAPAAERTEEGPAEPRLDLRSVRAREREQFGGMRFWLAFFGWLTATGLAVLLGAIAAGVLAAVGNSNGATTTSTGLQNLGLAGAIVTAVILFVAYYAGGYVAGRMARFDGAKQGVAVWLWAIIVSVLAAIAGAIGSQFGLFSQFGSVAQVPINGQTLTVAGLVGIVAALALSLLGAVLGGLAGMRYHRRVDRAAFGA